MEIENIVEIDITNEDEVKYLLQKMIKFVENYNDVKKDLENKIYIENGKQEDYLHELELAKLNGIELMQVSKKLKEVRINRRIYKNKLEMLEEMNSYVGKFITKGMLADSRILIENINKIAEIQITRKYKPRVIQNLKCAKQKGEEDEIKKVEL